MVMIDYWLAGLLGQVWLRFRKNLRDRLGDLPDLCRSVSRGQDLPAGQLWRVQNFAVAIWWRVALVTFVLMGAVGLTAKALSPHRASPGLVGGAVLILSWLAVATFGQVFVARQRSYSVRSYMRHSHDPLGQSPLPPGSWGRPKPADFWVALILTIGLAAAIWYFGAHSGSR
jgi:hypothetical protein